MMEFLLGLLLGLLIGGTIVAAIIWATVKDCIVVDMTKKNKKVKL